MDKIKEDSAESDVIKSSDRDVNLEEQVQISAETAWPRLTGWRKYIGLGTVTLSLLAALAISGKGIVAPIIFSLGALMLLPGYMQQPIPPDGEKVPIVARFVIWLVFFLFGIYFFPGQETTAADIPKDKQSQAEPLLQDSPLSIESKPVSSKSTPIPSEMPQPIQSSETKTEKSLLLHEQPLKNWSKASSDDRMDSALSMTKGVLKDLGEIELIAQAVELDACLTKMAESPDLKDQKIVSMAEMCAMGLGWKQE